jgi:hypothetical protein
MAKHDVALKIVHDVPIGNVDVEFPIRIDGKAFGRLKISRGGVDWLPTRSQKSGFELNWGEFGDLMKKYGNRK